MIKEILGLGIDPKSVDFINMICGGGNITLASEGSNKHVVFKSFTPAERKHMPGWLASWQNRGRRIGVCSHIINRQLGDERPDEEDFIGVRWFIARLPLGEMDILQTVKPPTFVMRTKSAIVAGWKLQFGIGVDEAKLAGEVILELLPCADLARFCDVPGFDGAELLSVDNTRVYHKSVFLPRAREIATPFTTPPAAMAAPAPKPRRNGLSGPAVMLGNHKDGGQVHWAPFESEDKLLNFGVLVTGDPGAGKTETLKVLINGVAGMGFPVCIFDFKNDYAERGFVQANKLQVIDIRRRGLPFNPLQPSAAQGEQIQIIEHLFTIAEVLKRCFGLGDRQTPILRDAMREAFEARGVNTKKWIDADAVEAPSFAKVIAILENNPQAAALRDRLSPLHDLRLFPAGNKGPSFEQMIDNRVVLSLNELPSDELKAALAELVIIRLHGVLLKRPQPRKLTRLIVVDEAWRIASSKHLENLAREGRAFGAGIAIGTQFPGDLPPDFAGALDTKIFLANKTPDHRKAVIKALCGGSGTPEAGSLQSTLERLQQFEGLIQNQQYLPYARFKLVPYFSRTGRTEVPDLGGQAFADFDEPEDEEYEAPAPRMRREPPAMPQRRQAEAPSVDPQVWLKEQLEAGAKPLVILTAAANEKGISRGRLKRAASQLRVTVKPIPGAPNNAKQWEL